MPALEVLGAIAVAIGAGYVLHVRYSKHASAVQSLAQMFIAVIWIAAAIATIASGFVISGTILLALFVYFLLGNYKNVHESDIPDDPREWRKRASNFNPFGFENKRGRG